MLLVIESRAEYVFEAVGQVHTLGWFHPKTPCFLDFNITNVSFWKDHFKGIYNIWEKKIKHLQSKFRLIVLDQVRQG